MLQLLFPTRCAVCDVVGPSPCPRCVALLQRPEPFEVPESLTSCAALLVYEGATRRLITALKYRNQRGCLDRLAAALAALSHHPVDAVTWAPTSTARRRARGFDQAELLARAVARALRLRCNAPLRRVSRRAQTGQTLAIRKDGPRFACPRPPPSRLLLVDDVLTTGATLSAAARALRLAGAGEVHGLVVARTPTHADLRPRQ